ncbi:MAG: cytochrome c5 family protein [Proteobacteria bacterium]|nr:MAG: cytochrome c5 family protein [Pseudomonadota bacterium]
MVQAVTETSASAQQSSNVTSPSSAADATAVTEGDSADTTDTGNDAQQSSDGSSTAVSSEAAAVTEAEGDSPDTAADSANGGDVFQQACAMCHTTGVAGAPKVGDIPAWENRIAQGAEMLYNHAINGFQGEAGLMPPKGGNMSLSDDDVRAAVDHMVNQSR